MKQISTQQAEAVLRLLSALECLEDPEGALPIPDGPELTELCDARTEVDAVGVKDALT